MGRVIPELDLGVVKVTNKQKDTTCLQSLNSSVEAKTRRESKIFSSNHVKNANALNILIYFFYINESKVTPISTKINIFISLRNGFQNT